MTANEDETPVQPRNGVGVRLTRLEAISERLLDEVKKLKADLRDLRAEFRTELREHARQSALQFRISVGLVLGVAALVVHGAYFT
jgi:hypothetical protein